MLSLKTGGLRFRIILLVLIAIIPISMLVLYTGFEERRLATDGIKRNMLLMVRLVAGRYEHVVQESNRLLADLAQLYEIRLRDTEACNRIFADFLRRHPEYDDFGLVNTQGLVLCSAHALTKPVDASDRPWFRKAVETRSFAVGEYQINRITGKADLAFAFPLIDETGRVQAVLFGMLDLSWFCRLAASAQLPTGAALTIRDRNGVVLSRYPDPEKWVGKSAPDAPIVREITHSGIEGSIDGTGMDGTRRIYGFVHLGDSAECGLYLSIGIPIEVAFGNINWILARNIGSLILLTFLVLAATRFYGNTALVKPLKTLLFTTNRLSEGNLRARAGLPRGRGEINQLGEALDNMAESLENLTGMLSQAEAKYRALVEQVPAAIYIASPDKSRSITYISPQVKLMLGFAPEEWIENGDFWAGRIHPEDSARVIEEHERSRMHAEPFRSEYRLLARDGHDVWIRDEATPIRNERGEFHFLQGIMRDVTLRKESENALRESEAKYRALSSQNEQILNAVAEGIFGMDPRGNIMFINEAALRITGFEREKLIGRKIHSILHHTKADGLPYPVEDCQVHSTLKDGIRRRVDSEIFWRPDGSSFPVEYISTPMRDEEGKIAGIVVSFEDISDRKRAEEERLRLATAVKEAGESILIMDTREVIRYVNPAFERISGYTSSEIIGQVPRILKSEKYDGVFFRRIREALSSGKVWKGRITYRKKDGSPFEVESTISPIRDGSGAIISYVAIERDVTDMALMERKLRQAQKMEAIGTLAGGIAHDFNNILSAILGYTEMAFDDLPKDNKSRGYLSYVLKAGTRAADLVKQILTFSRQGETERKPVHIIPILKEALKLLRASLPSTVEIRQRIEVSHESDILFADLTEIHQVIMNLCTNAAHAMREKGGELGVELEIVDVDESHAAQHPEIAPGPYLCITISDQGHGMSRETMERIFDPFYTTKKQGEGTGMGLAVVHGIVNGYGGAVSVSSEPGKGTTFRVLLPSHGSLETEIGDIATPLPAPGGKERILIVDDEPSLARMMREKLSRMGYDVTVKTNSLEALDLFRLQPYAFDLVITDQTMPHLTGIKLARELLSIREDLPIILCTGFSETVTPEAVKAAGVRKYMTKPFAFADLAGNIREILG